MSPTRGAKAAAGMAATKPASHVLTGFCNNRAGNTLTEEKHVLRVKSDCHHCFYTVSGGIRENETSESAVIRECYEETGYHFEIDRLVFIEERFFSVDNANHREIVFFYLMREADIRIVSGISTDQNNEHLYCIPLERLKHIDLVPKFLKTSLENIPSDITHILSYE